MLGHHKLLELKIVLPANKKPEVSGEKRYLNNKILYSVFSTLYSVFKNIHPLIFLI